MKRLLLILLSIFPVLSLNAQEKDLEARWTDEFLDTVQVKKTLKLNDYSMIGVQYGVGLSQVIWNPVQKQNMVFMPYNLGVTFTTYGKMFGYMPYFGFQAGVFYGQEGYEFKYNEDKDYTYTLEGAEKAVMDIVEVPILSHLHFDVWHFKIIAQIGMYGGYRLNIKRFAGKTGLLNPETANSFTDYEKRWDYGIKGGLGFGLVFDPIEIHFQAMYKHSLSSLYEPDYYSQYYYRFAYPSNIIVSAGVHFQLTKRSGATKKEIREKARKIVYETPDESSTSR
jgi:hypothetical protein